MVQENLIQTIIFSIRLHFKHNLSYSRVLKLANQIICINIQTKPTCKDLRFNIDFFVLKLVKSPAQCEI